MTDVTSHELTPSEAELVNLMASYTELKAKISALSDELAGIHQQIVSKVGHKVEGTQTTSVGTLKIVTKGVIYRKFGDNWATVREQIPRDFWPVKTVIDETLAKKALTGPYGSLLAQAIVETPGKVGLEIKV